MGQKAGKHAREGGDGEGSPSPKRSPKRSSKRGSKVSKSSSRESTPNPDLAEYEAEPRRSRQDIQRDLEQEKENPKKSNPKSPPRSPPKKAKAEPKKGKGKSPKKGAAAHEVFEEPMTVDTQPSVEAPIQPSQRTPTKMEPRELEPLTPLIINDTVDGKPQATSTPAANGVSTGQPSSPPLSPGSTTDQSDDEGYTPTEQQETLTRQQEPNFGRFYNTSYLDTSKSEYLRRSSNTLGSEKDQSKSPHFHRPANFTYSKDPPDFLKKKGSGMSALAAGKRVVKVRRSSSPGDMRNEEAIRMSMYPSAKPKAPNEPDKIERDDWPGPASPAAILPEILRERRRSRGEKDEEDELVIEDPKIQREMDEIAKIKDESGIGKVIFKELAELKQKPAKPMDPWKASRVPSAKYEPRYHTRYQSPMFASPSRFLDVTRRSWDDHDIRGYRSASTLANLPSARPGYGPSYSSTPRAATLPVTEMYRGHDLTYFGFRDIGDSDGHQRSNYTSTSTLTGDSMSRGRSGVSSIAAYDVPSIPLLKLQKSTWHTEADPPVYEYERLRITKFDLPRDVDRNLLEIHLNDDDFSKLFKMPRDRFYRLAEWKRNDMKKKHDLY